MSELQCIEQLKQLLLSVSRYYEGVTLDYGYPLPEYDIENAFNRVLSFKDFEYYTTVSIGIWITDILFDHKRCNDIHDKVILNAIFLIRDLSLFISEFYKEDLTDDQKADIYEEMLNKYGYINRFDQKVLHWKPPFLVEDVNYSNGMLNKRNYQFKGKFSHKGAETVWYPNGKIKIAHRIPSGHYSKYYSDGKIKETGYYTLGAKDLEWISYYQNGQLKERCNYADGLRVGLHEEYYPSGQLSKKCFYIKGMRSGKKISYYLNGKCKRITSYTRNTREGNGILYNEEGMLVEIKTYVNDGLNGPVEKYYDTGKLEYTGFYYMGNGAPKESASKDGVWKYYSFAGTLILKETYSNGHLHGLRKEYYPKVKKEYYKWGIKEKSKRWWL